MAFKHHLMIVILIIGGIFAVWQYIVVNTPPPAPPVTAQPKNPDGRAIQIIRASWGLNCTRYTVYDSNSTQVQSLGDFASEEKESPLKENNVLAAVSKLCGGQLKCDITLDPNTLGPDPAPQCLNKQLEVEYRCFNIDRPWRALSGSNLLTIDCTKGAKPNQP